MMHRLRSGLGSCLLFATALAGGPGLTLSEAWAHTHRSVPGHGHRVHYERPGGQDHDDRCQIGRPSSSGQPAIGGSAELRLAAPEPAPLARPAALFPPRIAPPLPASRAPPAVR